jgi:serine phosphatase RsbU (regulator of sigma subunit)/pSer/pThr/pTyr-binding forkhead associated (FHA) protein
MIKIFDPKDKMSRFWRLNEGTYIIGRGADCDLQINDDTISRKHARLEISADDSATITDLGSHNGIVIDGISVEDSATLNHNDTIELGQVLLKFVSSENSAEIKDSVKFKEDDGLTSVTMFPMEKALKSPPPSIAENPGIFNSFFEFGKMLIKPGENKEVFDNSLRLLKDVIPLERAAIFNLSGGKDKIALSAQISASKSNSQSFSISRTILNDLLERKEAVLVSDAQVDMRYAEQQSIISSGIKSAMAVPLYEEGEVFGVLYTDTSDPRSRYSEDHLRLVATFGNMLAAKISNNILLEDKRAKEILEAELAVASQIQKQLLPKSIPVVENYALQAYQSQCKQVGGDLYDISELEDGRILILLADVSGKGIGAALLASNILAAFRTLYNLKKIDMLEGTSEISKQLLDSTRPADFATLFIGILDPSSHSMRFINAGHNPPLVIRRNGNPEYLEASGIPIGMMDFNTWKEESVMLEPGDFILVFTDGIPEAMNRGGDQFGDERLEKYLLDNCDKTPGKLLKSLMTEVDNFIGDNPRSDDITLIALRRDGE